MANEILIEVLPEETKVAILENRELVEIYTERFNLRMMEGNIYRGRVTSVLPGMQAAFVDIGYAKNAFLYLNDVVCNNHTCNRVSELLTPGQELTVQVIKEASGNKGPRVTTRITLPGRYLVLLPGADHVKVSRKI